jgi:short-subunit dehydrogenase
MTTYIFACYSLAFANQGYKVALIARRAEAVEQGAKDIKEKGGDVSALIPLPSGI